MRAGAALVLGRVQSAFQGRDVLLLLVVLLGASAGWVFVEVADAALEHPLPLERRLLLAFRRPGALHDAWGPPIVEEMVRDLSALGSPLIALGLTAAVAGGMLLAGRTWLAWLLVLAAGGGAGGIWLFKDLFARARPALVPALVEVESASFPSGHAALASLVYLTLAALAVSLMRLWRLRVYTMAWAVLLVVSVGLSRIYLGVHWPSDVVGGWAFGVAWSAASALVMRLVAGRAPASSEAAARGARPRGAGGCA